MEKPENSASFYKLLYNEELYHVRGQNNYSGAGPAPAAAAAEKAETYTTGHIPYEGQTAGTLILFSYAGGQVPQEDRAFLDQVLRAAGMSYDTVGRLNTMNLGDTTWEEIAAGSRADYVIAFGVPMRYLPSGIGEGQIYNINNKRVLSAAGLKDLAANNLRKKLLWQGMKEIYGL